MLYLYSLAFQGFNSYSNLYLKTEFQIASTSLFVQEGCCFCSWTLWVCSCVIGSYTGPLWDPARVPGKSLRVNGNQEGNKIEKIIKKLNGGTKLQSGSWQSVCPKATKAYLQ